MLQLNKIVSVKDVQPAQIGKRARRGLSRFLDIEIWIMRSCGLERRIFEGVHE